MCKVVLKVKFTGKNACIIYRGKKKVSHFIRFTEYKSHILMIWQARNAFNQRWIWSLIYFGLSVVFLVGWGLKAFSITSSCHLLPGAAGIRSQRKWSGWHASSISSTVIFSNFLLYFIVINVPNKGFELSHITNLHKRLYIPKVDLSPK